jgi:hypothetical protein
MTIFIIILWILIGIVFLNLHWCLDLDLDLTAFIVNCLVGSIFGPYAVFMFLQEKYNWNCNPILFKKKS